MNPVQLLFAVHCHQPVGNFDSVYARAFDRAYQPFLEVLGKHPRIRVALHLSGPLLDWTSRERPAFLSDVRALVSRKQVEVLGGGLEEPILTSLPDRDAFGQIQAMTARVRELFGVEPKGLWLAERVWEPDLPRLLAPLGMRYTFVDDSHLRAAGVEGALRGYYVTEKAGAAVALFPIDRQLRYRIPYAKVSEVLGYLRGFAEGPNPPGGRGITFGDDGEKLGFWPDTHEWVYARGWLSQLFTALEGEGESIESVLPGDYLERFGPTARVYVPSASYEEMMDWALPAPRARRLESFRRELEKDPAHAEDLGFVHGASWPAFLAKYPEANALHKRMLRVSNKLAEAETELGQTARLVQARAELYRGQCNCAYWHGVFGGLYLPHLRHAVYAALIRAENLIDAESRGEGDFIEYDENDFDCDLRDEAVLANSQLSAMVDPDEGGALVELDFRPQAICVTHVMSRREEAYHQHLRELKDRPAPKRDDGAPPNIHLNLAAKEPGLAGKLVEDGYRRLCFIDRFYAPGFGLEQLVRGGDGDIGEFSGQPYGIEAGGVDEDGDLSASVTLVREASLNLPEGARKILVEKTFHLPIDTGKVEAEYIIENQADTPMAFTFAPELNLTLLSAQEPERYLELPDGTRASLAAKQNHGSVNGLRLIDEQQGVAVELGLDREAEIWSYPVETVNLSEEGFERTYQGTCFLVRMAISLPPRESARIVMRIELAKVELEPEPEPENPEPAA
jgi:4-alpha-glucanotransferase